MTKHERIAVAVAAVIVAAVIVVFTTGILHWLAGQETFNAGANVIQWTSGPATFAAVGVIVYQFFVRRCAMPLCVRRGEHPVDGTLKKVCHQHHTLEHHLRVHDLFGAAHTASARLHWGQSHYGWNQFGSSSMNVTVRGQSTVGGVDVQVGDATPEPPEKPKRKRVRKPGTQDVTDLSAKRGDG